jgi:hypothetical protein
MLVACRLAGLSALEAYYADVNRRRNADPPRYPNAATPSPDARNHAPVAAGRQGVLPTHRSQWPAKAAFWPILRGASDPCTAGTRHQTINPNSCGAVAIPVGTNDLAHVDGGAEAFPQNFRPRLEIVGSLPKRLAEDLAMFGLRGSAMRRRSLF